MQGLRSNGRRRDESPDDPSLRVAIAQTGVKLVSPRAVNVVHLMDVQILHLHKRNLPCMAKVTLTRPKFLEDRQGRTFADVLDDRSQPFDDVLQFFNDEGRQRRMEESEIHHDRAPLAGVVRELEAQGSINRFLAGVHPRRSQRLRQSIGVVVRMIMERRGWTKSGKKGSLGIRSARAPKTPRHNSGGLAFWFVRAERYHLAEGMPFATVRARYRNMASRTTTAPRKTGVRAKTSGPAKSASAQARKK